MSDKPVISTETDRMDKGMLDQVCSLERIATETLTKRQLLLQTGTLGSIYHKNPNVRFASKRMLHMLMTFSNRPLFALPDLGISLVSYI